jgi:hypothetical protein
MEPPAKFEDFSSENTLSEISAEHESTYKLPALSAELLEKLPSESRREQYPETPAIRKAPPSLDAEFLLKMTFEIFVNNTLPESKAPPVLAEFSSKVDANAEKLDKVPE